jgi:tRNA pseudouridine38-40 synthase
MGKHDCASFTSNPGYERETTVRTMSRAAITRHGATISFLFTADGFLYRMVRNLVGALVLTGRGRITPDDFGRILRARSRSEAPATAPACGLYLVRVKYPPKT